MSIRDNMIQQVLGNPGKYSIQQLQKAGEDGTLPMYIVAPLIQDKMQQQKQMQQQQVMQQQPVKKMPPIVQQVMQEAQMAQAAPGVEGLPSNLPQEYAGGGIVAFDEGGEVEHFQAGGRSQYEEYIRRRASELGVDPDLAMRMFATESSFNPQAVSPKGAVGIGQLMPGTAKELGLAPEERTDPMKNIDASLRYFKQQQERFGDPQKAAAAYNMGPTALTRFLEKTGGVLDRGGLNPETAKYLTNLFPVGSAVAGERAPAAAPAPQGIAQLAAAPPMPMSGDQPTIEPGYGDIVRGGVSPSAREVVVGKEESSEEATTPFGRALSSVTERVKKGQANAKLQQAVAAKFGPQASMFGLAMKQSDEERDAAKEVMSGLRDMSDEELRAALQAPNAVSARDLIKTAQVSKQQKLAAAPEPETAGMATAMPGAPKETQVAAAATQQPGDIAPAPVDIMSLVQDAPSQLKSALGELINNRKAELDKMDEPSIALLEKRQAERGKRLEGRKEQDTMNAALAFLVGVAGTRGHWSEALGKGAKEGLHAYVTSQAAQQAAEDKFNEAADALELRKLALKKDNQTKADAYGEKYASLMLQGTKLQVEGAYHYNANQIAAFDAGTKREALAAGKKRLDIAAAQAQAGNIKAKTALLTAGTKAIQQWDTSTEKRAAEASIAEKYGKDWMKLPLKNDKRIAAQAELDQEKARWVSNNMAMHAAMGTFGGDDIAANVKSYEDLMGS